EREDEVQQAGSEKGDEGDGEQDAGEGEEGVHHDDVDEAVDASAVVSGDGADDQAEQERGGDDARADQHGDARAVEDAGVDVAPEFVGAEPVRGGWALKAVGQADGGGIVAREQRREQRAGDEDRDHHDAGGGERVGAGELEARGHVREGSVVPAGLHYLLTTCPAPGAGPHSAGLRADTGRGQGPTRLSSAATGPKARRSHRHLPAPLLRRSTAAIRRALRISVPRRYSARSRAVRAHWSLSNARVDGGVEHVREKVYGDIREANGQDAALDDIVVAVADGGDGEAAESGPGKDRFRHDGAGEQRAELQSNDGQHGDERVAERVAIDDVALGHALGARGADVVLAEFFEHGCAHHAGEDGGEGTAQRDGRENKAGPTSGAGDGQKAEIDGEEQYKDGTEGEVGK